MEKTYERPIIDFPSFPENLRKIRKERGLTFRMLALICEATPANLCRYEQGVHMPRTKTLASICRALGVPLNELLGPFKVKSEVTAEQSMSKPVGYVSGFYGGYCVIQPLDPAVVLPVGMALYLPSLPYLPSLLFLPSLQSLPFLRFLPFLPSLPPIRSR